MPLIQKEKELLVAHLIRDERTIQAALDKLQPELWNEPFEEPYQALWALSQEYYKLHRAPIPDMHMITSLERRIHMCPELVEHTDYMAGILEWVYSCVPADFNSDAVVPTYLQSMLDERVLLSNISTLGTDRLAEKFLQMQKTYEATRVTSATGVNVMDLDNPELDAMAIPPVPTGCQIFDTMVGGGIRPGHMTGVLGSFESGKTAFSINLAVEVAKSRRYAFLFQYEQDVMRDVRPRMWACLTGIPSTEFSDKPYSQLSQSIKDQLKSVAYVGDYLIPIDMQKQGRGNGGAAEICSVLNEYRTSGKHPSVVIIDWLGMLASRYCGTNGMDTPEERRVVMANTCGQLREIANRMKTEVVITHQLNGVAGSQAPNHRPSMYDAADYKQFASVQDTCIVLCRKDPDNIALVFNDKQRGSHSQVWCRIDGQFARFVPLEGEFTSYKAEGLWHWSQVAGSVL